MLPLLLALAPEYKADVLEAARALAPAFIRGVAQDGIPVRLRDASGTAITEADSGGTVQMSLEAVLVKSFNGDEAIARRFASAIDGHTALADASASAFSGGIVPLLLTNKNDVGRLQLLRRALRALQPDRTFDLDWEPLESPYLNAAARLGSATRYRYVVFGHTHHAKDITLDDGTRYFNTGTWADLMHVPAEVISEEIDTESSALQDFLDRLAIGDLQSLRVCQPHCLHLILSKDAVREAHLFQVMQ
jgi:hypothetical protein